MVKKKCFLLKLRDKIFLINLKKIYEICKNIVGYKKLLEIGPGYGNLTDFIYKKFDMVILVEKEKKFCSFLKTKYKKAIIINKSILDYKINFSTVVVGNLPYSITNKIINKIILEKKKIKMSYIMIQKELFESIANKKTIRSFLILLNYKLSLISSLDGKDFFPVVKVKSVFIKMKPYKFNFSKKIENFLNKHSYFIIKNKKTIFKNFFFNFYRKKNNSSISIIENFFFILFIYKKINT